MLKPVSVASVSSGYAGLATYAGLANALSGEAREARKAALAVIHDREGSESLFGRKASARSNLQSAVVSVSPNDEQDAVDAQTYQNALDFLLSLPDDLPAPEFGVDPDGAISFDWMPSRTRMFSISISASERVAYAWINGSDKGYGVVRFRHSAIPAPLLFVLEPFLRDDFARLQVA